LIGKTSSKRQLLEVALYVKGHKVIHGALLLPVLVYQGLY